MKEKVSKYILELLIIVCGISLSFYVDNYASSVEKNRLKNHVKNSIISPKSYLATF